MNSDIILAILDAVDQDSAACGHLIRALRGRLPDIDWMAILTITATAYQPFIDSGLSVEWWLSEVERQAV